MVFKGRGLGSLGLRVSSSVMFWAVKVNGASTDIRGFMG